MTRYTLFTWPDSQEFVSNGQCLLVMPPADDKDLHLDSAYLVPDTVHRPAPGETVYTMASPGQTDGIPDRDDNILRDYEGNTFVKSSLLRKEGRPGKGTALLVTFKPTARICVTLPKGKTLQDAMADERLLHGIIRAAVRQLAEEASAHLEHSVESILEDTECPFGTLTSDKAKLVKL